MVPSTPGDLILSPKSYEIVGIELILEDQPATEAVGHLALTCFNHSVLHPT